jgi:BatD DUF11 like domain
MSPRLFIVCFLWLVSWVVPARLLAQPILETRIEPKEAVEGSLIEIEFTLKNGETTRFTPPSFKPFKVVEGPSVSQGMSIINGVTSIRQSWLYILQTPQPGLYTIGPASAVVKGQTLQSQAVPIRIVPASGKNKGLSAAPGNTDDLFVSAELDHNTAFVGQQVSLSIKIYTLLSLEYFDVLNLPDLTGAFVQEKKRFDTRLQYVRLRGKEYAVKTLYALAVYPQHAGDLTIGAAQIRVGVQQSGGFGGIFGAAPALLQTQPLTLKVKPLPEPAPAGFSGGVGQYIWEVKADRDTLTTDDVLTLSVTLRGNGDQRRFSLPVLTVPPGFEVFDPKTREEETYENGEYFVHSKTLDYALVPRTPGVYTLNPTLSCFDPDSNRYVTHRPRQPIVVRVGPGQGLHNTDSTLAPATTEATQHPWRVTLRQFFRSPLWWGLLAILASGFILWWVLRPTRPKPTAVVAPPPRQAEPPANFDVTALRPLLTGPAAEFYDALSKAMQEYLLRQLDLPPEQWSKTTLREALRQKAWPAYRIEEVMALFDTCEQALYAAQDRTIDMENALRRASEIMTNG